jgi:hypothetical protein
MIKLPLAFTMERVVLNHNGRDYDLGRLDVVVRGIERIYVSRGGVTRAVHPYVDDSGLFDPEPGLVRISLPMFFDRGQRDLFENAIRVEINSYRFGNRINEMTGMLGKGYPYFFLDECVVNRGAEVYTGHDTGQRPISYILH